MPDRVTLQTGHTATNRKMQEEYLATRDPTSAVGNSLGTTGRVIVSAALVMFAVFISFVSNPNPTVKQIGLGLAVGVFVDAMIVRLFLVPSVMRIVGRAGWWLPRWLDNVLPNLSIEGPAEPVEIGDDSSEARRQSPSEVAGYRA